MVMLFILSFFMSGSLISLEPHRCIDTHRKMEVCDACVSICSTDAARFCNKWFGDQESGEHRTKEDGSIIGDFALYDDEEKAIVVGRDSLLKIIISPYLEHELIFSLDGVIFTNGEVGQYTQTFKDVHCTTELSFPVIAGCNIKLTSVRGDTWIGYILIPLERDVIEQYHEQLL